MRQQSWGERQGNMDKQQGWGTRTGEQRGEQGRSRDGDAFPGMSLRARSRGFPLVTMNEVSGYFHWKIKEK